MWPPRCPWVSELLVMPLAPHPPRGSGQGGGSPPASQPQVEWAWMGGGGCQGSVVPIPGHLFLSPQPGGLRREAGVLTENLTPALAGTLPGILRLSLPASLASHLQTTLPRPNPHSSLHRRCEGMGIRKEETQDKLSTGGSGTPPSAPSLGSRKQGFLFLGFRLLAPPRGLQAPRV